MAMKTNITVKNFLASGARYYQDGEEGDRYWGILLHLHPREKMQLRVRTLNIIIPERAIVKVLGMVYAVKFLQIIVQCHLKNHGKQVK